MFCHFFRKRRSHFTRDDKRGTDRDQEKRKELAASETGDERRIGFAKILDHDPKDRVEDKKEADQNAVRLPHSCAAEPEDREQDNPFKESFVELRRMPRRQNGP